MDEQSLRGWGAVIVKIAAWGWTLIAGGGGLGLLILQGPWPPTNGWFAMFSGVSACPLWPSFLRQRAKVNLPGWVQPVIAVSLAIADRVALIVERRLGIQLPAPL